MLNVPLTLEDTMVDFLLAIENTQGFSSFPVYTHDHNIHGLSLSEQVSGRQRKIRFQINTSKTNLAEILTKLKAEFTGTGLQYWVLPIIEFGLI